MFCINCGKELADGIKFCPECGTAVVGNTYENHEEPKVETTESNQPIQPDVITPVAPPQVRTHPLTIVGFVLSFFVPLVGLILSIIARNKINKDPLIAGSKELTVAGIVISIVELVLSTLIYGYFALFIIAAIFSYV